MSRGAELKKRSEPEAEQPRPSGMTATNADITPVVTRGRPRDPELDDEIMAAAVHLIATHGVEGLTMDAVARRAGVAKASIYRRFASKVDLLAAACAAVCPTALDAPDTGSARDDLVELIGAIVESFRAKSTNKLMPTVLAASSTNPDVSEALQKFSNSRRSRLVEVVRRGIDRGELDEHLDQELLGDQLVGVVLYRFLVTGRPLSKPVIERLVDQVLAGVSPR
jgi:AcrR family transcriptional regulator